MYFYPPPNRINAWKMIQWTFFFIFRGKKNRGRTVVIAGIIVSIRNLRCFIFPNTLTHFYKFWSTQARVSYCNLCINFNSRYLFLIVSFILKTYCISAKSFRGNYSFFNSTLCTVTFGDRTYRCRNYSRAKLFKGGNYSRKYGNHVLSIGLTRLNNHILFSLYD